MSDAAETRIRQILGQLPEAEAERIIRRLAADVDEAEPGGVLGVLIRILPTRSQWSVMDLRSAVRQSGVTATAKQVYNALGYLKRKGRIFRDGYGLYSFEQRQDAS